MFRFLKTGTYRVQIVQANDAHRVAHEAARRRLPPLAGLCAVLQTAHLLRQPHEPSRHDRDLGLAAPQLRPFVRPVAAKDYWEKGLLRRRIALDELNVVLVDRRRTEHSNPLDPLRQALQEGSSLIIFPEGTRRPQPLPSEFKSGIWRLMKEFPQVELIPVYIENLHRAMPKGVLLPVPTVCSIRFGAPLEHSPEDLKEDFLERARNAIISLAQP